jgi:NRPS condensation-like uncharacterized protein
MLIKLMNAYNKIKAATFEYSKIPQYFFASYEFSGQLNQEALEKAFEQVNKPLLEGLQQQNKLKSAFGLNSIEFYDEDMAATKLHDYAMDFLQAHYLSIIEKNQAAPVILTVFSNAKCGQVLFVYLVNHVYLDFTAFKLIHTALGEQYTALYINKPLEKTVVDKFSYPTDTSFLTQSVEKLKRPFLATQAKLLQEMYNGSYIASAFNRVKRSYFLAETMSHEVVFKRYTFDNSTLANFDGLSKNALTSALICKAYMDAFDSHNCHYVLPFDLRSKPTRWAIGNFIAGAYVAVDENFSLLDCADEIQRITDRYKDLTVFFSMYALVVTRLKLMSKKAIFKKANKYLKKSHFISTNVGNIERAAGKLAKFKGLELNNTFAYSYPLQLNIGLSLSVSYFKDQFTINLSAARALVSDQQLEVFHAAILAELMQNKQVAA